MIKKIKELSKVFIKDYFQNLYIFNKDTKKINKKSIFTWLIIIVLITISFMSYKVIDWLNMRGQGILFLEIYLPIIAIIMLFQSAIICSSVFYFSKDLEYILPLPIKPIELLISKYNNVLSIIYTLELLLLGMPLIIYGLMVARNFIYIITMILVLIIFPIFFATIISTLMLFIMQLTKFIKNKDIFQIIVVTLMSLILSLTIINITKPLLNNISEIQLDQQILENKLNNYFIVINPCISLLTNFKIINIFWQLIKLIFICISSFIIFIIFGKLLYLKNLLKNIAYINKNKKNNKIIKNKYEKNSIKKSYIKNEIKKLIKNPTFFIQCIFQYLLIMIIILSLIKMFMPMVLTSFEEQDIIKEMGTNDFALQVICICLGIIQIIFTFGNISLTAISREGKNAIVMKYIPISLYKQFIWKNIPQIILNTIAIFGVIITISNNIPKVSIWYYVAGIIIAILLNIINSFIMLIVDLKKPNLDWTTESASLNDNGNKLYQYVTTIIIIMLLSYMTKILKGINIITSLILIIIIFICALILINLYVKKNINKLFKKIN